MKTSYLKLSLLLLTIVIMSSMAQAQDALWQLDFDKEIVFNQNTDAGILLVGTSDWSLHGVDSRDGNKLWTSEIMDGAKQVRGADGKKIDAATAFKDFVSVLEDPDFPEISDFIEIKYKDATGMYKNYAVINLRTGAEVMSPEKAEMPITKFLGKEMITFNYNGTGYIPQLRMIIISASWQDFAQKGAPWMNITKMVELPSAKVIWTNNEVAVDGYPYVMENGDIVLPGKFNIARMESKTGKVKWYNAPSEKNQTYESFDLSLDLTTGYFFEKKKNNGALLAVDMASGKKIWEQEMKLKEVPAMSAMGYGVVVIDDKNFTLYDLASGAEKWVAKKIDGYVIDLGDNGIAATSKGKRLVLLDKETGNVVWDEKIQGIQIDQIAAKGIMYSDVKGRLGFIQYDGQKIWDKKGMLEVPTLRYKPEFTKEIMYIDGDLYEVDLMTGDYSVLKAKLDKEFDKEDTPNNIELVEGGYLISSDQALLMLEKDGSIRFKKYWEAPGLSMAAKIALRVGQAAAIAMAASAAVESSRHKTAYGGDTYYSKMYAQQADDWAAIAGMAGAATKQKFSATVSKGNIRMILTRVGEGGQGKSSGLMKVDKRTGEEMGSLLLGDKKPIYDYDPVSGQVFFKADNKQIISYSF
ncbi:PQQ-binding-like beta-propeller repeat protein [Reichenbachiella sp. MALMAid0571]|uniref:outer membrane protein assembly factor BamB family protein n=1 Tax=Reichenbachiella sp. MALMAid0571 TaxID=3143939 RepID=UPI0032DF5618